MPEESSSIMTGDPEDSVSQNISIGSKKGSDDEEEKEEESGNESGEDQAPAGNDAEGDVSISSVEGVAG